MAIALVSCRELPGWEIDDAPFHRALQARGIAFSQVPWDAEVDWTTFELCLIRTTWDYHHHRERFVDWAAQVPRLVNAASIVRWNTEKTYLRALETRGIPIIETAWVKPGDDVTAVLQERGWEHAFLKPVVGATAAGTLRFTDPSAGQAHLDAHGTPMLLQEYLSGVETEGELSAIWIDGTITHAVQKVPVPGDYRVQDDWGATDHPIAIDQVREPAEAALAAARALLEDEIVYARVDFLRDNQGQLRLTELELVEPSLFFRHGPTAADALAEAVARRLGSAT